VGQEDYYHVTAQLHVTRKFQNYIVKLIMPMFIIVTLSTLTYWIDPGSPPARVGGTVTLVLSIVTFNLVVSQDLPKINYSTLLDWYVWKCFLFVVFAVGEFAVVNNILTSKVLPPRVGFLIDDFCAFTLTPTWLLSNLLFWPILNVGESLIVGAIEIGFFSLNVLRVSEGHDKTRALARRKSLPWQMENLLTCAMCVSRLVVLQTYWNYKHDKIGIKDSSKASVVAAQLRGLVRPPPPTHVAL
jgi:hypothetical protein